MDEIKLEKDLFEELFLEQEEDNTELYQVMVWTNAEYVRDAIRKAYNG